MFISPLFSGIASKIVGFMGKAIVVKAIKIFTYAKKVHVVLANVSKSYRKAAKKRLKRVRKMNKELTSLMGAKNAASIFSRAAKLLASKLSVA